MNMQVTVDLVGQAAAFAHHRFAGQKRGGKQKLPAFNHMREVAQLIDEAYGSEDEVAAAWLHDVLEDTDTTLEEIKTLFGPHVAVLVLGLTDPPGMSSIEGKHSTYQRKLLQAERLSNEPRSVKLIKLADQISNLRTVRVDPPEDWSHEKTLQYILGAYEVCKHCLGISPLLDEYFVEAYEAAHRTHQ